MNSFVKLNTAARQIDCLGEWNLSHLNEIESALLQLTWPASGNLKINGSAITKMDTAAALLLKQWIEKLKKKGLTSTIENFSPSHQTLLMLVDKHEIQESKLPKIIIPSWLAKIGKNASQQIAGLQQYLAFIGKLSVEMVRILYHPAHLRWKAIAGVIFKNGYNALPIIALLSFMIGVVITYQMGIQLRSYGANIFIVDLLGLSVLREFGPLLTAIMIAGRTGSSYTAQLGIMKMNQEIDALDTMGVTPGELLLLPRMIGLVIALPLLTVWADIFGVLGGIVMSNNLLSITWNEFLERFQAQIPLKALIIGIGKTPVFALLIASIGCFQGMQVQGNADSIGKNTTRSVVLGIFFIIVADALFSIIFSKLKL